MLVKLIIGMALAYGLVVVAGISLQRRLLYRVDPLHVTPADVGLAGVNELQITAPDGARLMAWHGKALPGRPTLLYFHGNSGSLAARTPRFERFMDQGWGVFMMTYRGYGGSTGTPTESNNIADGIRAFDALTGMGIPPGTIVLYGESLGTGIASRVALQRSAAGLILDAPFTSIPEVAAQRFWFLPMRLMMRDQYDTARIIAQINMPLLILHGTQDAVVPVQMGRELARLAKQPKTYVELPRGGHSDLYLNGNDALSEVRSFLGRLKQ